jgi:hypothetical protein
MITSTEGDLNQTTTVTAVKDEVGPGLGVSGSSDFMPITTPLTMVRFSGSGQETEVPECARQVHPAHLTR